MAKCHHLKSGHRSGRYQSSGRASANCGAPALHQADHGDDDDADREPEQPAPFAADRQAETDPGKREPQMRPLSSKAVHERRDREQAEGKRENIQHRDPRLHEQHLVEKGEQARRNRRPLRREQRQAAQIHRDDGERSEQDARIAPAQRPVAERTDRQCDELLGERRMHRIEHRLWHHRLEHLPRSRHVMHFVEIEFLRRGDADQHREMRENKKNCRGDACAEHRQWTELNVMGLMASRRIWHGIRVEITLRQN